MWRIPPALLQELPAPANLILGIAAAALAAAATLCRIVFPAYPLRRREDEPATPEAAGTR